jgi:hypothetical protein
MLDDVATAFAPLIEADQPAAKLDESHAGARESGGDWTPLPLPPGTFPDLRHESLGVPAKTWPYINPAGELEGYRPGRGRYRRKDFPPSSLRHAFHQ